MTKEMRHTQNVHQRYTRFEVIKIKDPYETV